MSYVYSRALVEAYLGGSCLDGTPSALLKSNPTARAFSPKDKMTDFCRLSQFGMTLGVLTESLGEELLKLYRADFPVKTYPQQEQAKDSTESEAGCGNNSGALLARYSPDTHSLRTVQCSLFEDSTEFCVTLPRWGSMRNGELRQRQALGHHTAAKEFGSLLPTPTATNANQGAMSTNSDGLPLLPMAARTWQSTNVRDSSALWPTPCATDYKGSGKTGELRDRLDYAAERGGTKSKTYEKPKNIGKLNPAWVEWLMNWPIGWSELQGLSNAEYKHWQEASAEKISDLRGRPLWFEQDPSEATYSVQVSRVAVGLVARVDRLKSIGNGQVPQQAAAAWRLLTGQEGTE